MNELNAELPVRVYWDSTRKIYSIKQKGRVVAKTSGLIIKDPSFEVFLSGWRRYRETGRKVPHAFVRGLILNCEDSHEGYSVMYNPAREPLFMMPVSGMASVPIFSAKLCIMTTEQRKPKLRAVL